MAACRRTGRQRWDRIDGEPGLGRSGIGRKYPNNFGDGRSWPCRRGDVDGGGRVCFGQLFALARQIGGFGIGL